MKTLQIDEKKAKQLYKGASQEFKTMLDDSFGKDFFNQKITDQIKSFDDACTFLGIKDTGMSITINCDGNRKDVVSAQAYSKLIIIVRALNEGWQPDWSNENEYKYFPYFKYKSGFGFSYTFCECWNAITFVGSRLCFKTRELAEYAGKQFESIYQDYLTI